MSEGRDDVVPPHLHTKREGLVPVFVIRDFAKYPMRQPPKTFLWANGCLLSQEKPQETRATRDERGAGERGVRPDVPHVPDVGEGGVDVRVGDAVRQVRQPHATGAAVLLAKGQEN